jgi:peptidoglycan/xylan/chitin deacetylase (PgdA/CDA1 family)/GT2 family glycosyltransferase
MSGGPKISVVIPTHNRVGTLSRTLVTLFRQDLDSDQYEIVVVVDGSTDGTVAFLRGLKAPCALRLLEQPNRGLPGARNAGIKAARGELVLFIDDDILCSASLLKAHAAAHESRDPSVVFGATFVSPESPQTLVADLEKRAWRNIYRPLMRNQAPQFPANASLGNNASAPRSLLLDCGGCDEELLYLQDYELGIRVWKMGVPFNFVPEAVVYHLQSKSIAELLGKDARGQAVCQLKLCRKRPEFRSFSRLALVADGNFGKRKMRGAIARLPFPVERIAQAALLGSDRLRKFERYQLFGLGLLGIAINVGIYRGARRAAGSWRALRREFGTRLPVLAYHHVGPRRVHAYTDFTIATDQFTRQMEWLARHGYVGIRPSQWLAWRREGKALPRRPVLITFDDGYADTVDHAFPVLRRLGFGAAMYVVTGRLGASKNWGETWGPQMSRLMSVEQVEHLAREGLIEIGAHGRTHADLTTLGEAQLRDEVEGSADDLDRIMGRRPLSFAYPYGAYNAAVRECVARTYELGLSCETGLNTLASDVHMMRRTEIYARDGIMDFAWRVRIGAVPLAALRSRLRLRTRTRASLRRLRERFQT